MAGRNILSANKVFGLPMDLLLPSLVGILALTLVMGGNVYIEAEKSNHPGWNAPPPSPEVRYDYEEKELFSLQGRTDEDATSDQNLGALPENVTAIRAVLRWTDDIGSNDVLALAIAVNGTVLGSAEGRSGTLEISVLANDTTPGSELITGEFAASVTAVECPGRVGPLPRDLDDGNDWTLEVYVTVRTRA